MIDMTSSRADVLMLIKTSALDYDDRLRKEIESVIAAGRTVEVVCLQDDNESRQGTTWGGVSFDAMSLLSRRWFSSHSFICLHILEFLFRVVWRGHLKKRKVVWVHDPVMITAIPVLVIWRYLSRSGRLVWDQHELPPQGILRFSISKYLFSFLCGLPDTLINANAARVTYLKRCGALSQRQDVMVIRNFSDGHYADQAVQELPDPVHDWLNGESYVLLQGGGLAVRHFEPVLKAVLTHGWPNDLKLVVVGRCDQQLVEKWQGSSPVRFAERVYLVGMIPQMELTRFSDHALCSLILYSDHIPNQKYCEPNRLYQALCRGTPVVVGDNPPMAEIVRETGAGVVLSGDGSDPEMIVAGIREGLLKADAFARKARQASTSYTWQAQVPTLLKVFD